MVSQTEMIAQLLPLETVQDLLAQTEPLSELTFDCASSTDVRFRLEPGWNHGLDNAFDTDDVKAFIKIGKTEYVLTKQAVLEATSAIGIPKNYVSKTPSKLIEPHLNYWYSGQPRQVKALAADTRVLAFTKSPSIRPFSNLRLVEIMVNEAQKKFPEYTDPVFDFKAHHSIDLTSLRMVIPPAVRMVKEDDPWSIGIDLTNSLTGRIPTAERGYMFRWTCANGAITTSHSSGNWSRRAGGQGEEVYEWARAAVDEILGGLEAELDMVTELTTTPLKGELGDVMRDIFEQYAVPLAARESIINMMAESDDITAYGLMNAITMCANDGNIKEGARRHLMEVGGELPHALTHRCPACHKVNVGTPAT